MPVKPLPSRLFWVGVGCQRGASSALIEQAIRVVFRASNLAEVAIAGLATIETKRNEAGLIAFCRDRDLPLFFYAADVLRSVTVPHPSGAIDAIVGTPSVAEAAALLACWGLGVGGWGLGGGGREKEGEREAGEDGEHGDWEQKRGEAEKTASNTFACLYPMPHAPHPTPHTPHPIPQLYVSKQRYGMKGQPGAVTIAVARARSSS